MMSEAGRTQNGGRGAPGRRSGSTTMMANEYREDTRARWDCKRKIRKKGKMRGGRRGRTRRGRGARPRACPAGTPVQRTRRRDRLLRRTHRVRGTSNFLAPRRPGGTMPSSPPGPFRGLQRRPGAASGCFRERAAMQRLSKSTYLGTIIAGYGIYYVLAAAGLLVQQSGGRDAANTGGLLVCAGVIPLVVAVVVQMVLLYKLWAAIQDPVLRPRTTPGYAVGLLFVPFYNLYWIFQAYWGWAV